MKNLLKLTLFLGIVAALCTGILATVNVLTRDKIAEQAAGAETASLELLYPDATSFTRVEDFEQDSTGLVTDVFQVDDTAYVFKVSSQGYSSPIIFLIGFDNDGSNSKYIVLEQNDTAGIGDRVKSDEYVDSLTGLATTDSFPLISGATTSSTAVNKGISAAVEVFNALTGSTGGPSTEEPEETASATLIDTIEADGLITYIVEAKGFYPESLNVFEITIDTETHTITQVVNTEFNDTQGIGDAAVTDEHLQEYVGHVVSEDLTVDVVSGATFTSESVDSAVQLALDTYFEEVLLNAPPVEIDGVITYTVQASGFYDESNVFTVSIDIATDTITEVKNIKFSDTVGIGDAAVTEKHLQEYVGHIVSDELAVDAVSGATVTSGSVNIAVQSAIDQYNERSE